MNENDKTLWRADEGESIKRNSPSDKEASYSLSKIKYTQRKNKQGRQTYVRTYKRTERESWRW